MVYALARESDLDHRSLGYEPSVTRHIKRLPPTKPNKTLQNRAAELVRVARFCDRFRHSFATVEVRGGPSPSS